MGGWWDNILLENNCLGGREEEKGRHWPQVKMEMVMIHHQLEVTPKNPEFLLAFILCQKTNLSLINKG